MAFGAAGAAPFLVGGRSLMAQRVAVGSARPVRDPVIDQITHELGRVHASVKKHGVRAQHVHDFAGQVRVLLVHAKAVGLDERAKRGVGGAVDANGRDAVIDTEVDDKKRGADLTTFGFDPSDRTERAPLDRATRARLVDAMLVGGVTPRIERLNAALVRAEDKAERFEADRPLARTGMLVQDCWQSWGVIIDELSFFADICAWFAPELAAMFGACALLCEVGMYVTCWGG
jgi:hypothetical protein